MALSVFGKVGGGVMALSVFGKQVVRSLLIPGCIAAGGSSIAGMILRETPLDTKIRALESDISQEKKSCFSCVFNNKITKLEKELEQIKSIASSRRIDSICASWVGADIGRMLGTAFIGRMLGTAFFKGSNDVEKIVIGLVGGACGSLAIRAAPIPSSQQSFRRLGATAIGIVAGAVDIVCGLITIYDVTALAKVGREWSTFSGYSHIGEELAAIVTVMYITPFIDSFFTSRGIAALSHSLFSTL